MFQTTQTRAESILQQVGSNIPIFQLRKLRTEKLFTSWVLVILATQEAKSRRIEPAPANSLQDPISKRLFTHTKKGW
jgi:hypothetical protein